MCRWARVVGLKPPPSMIMEPLIFFVHAMEEIKEGLKDEDDMRPS